MHAPGTCACTCTWIVGQRTSFLGLLQSSKTSWPAFDSRRAVSTPNHLPTLDLVLRTAGVDGQGSPSSDVKAVRQVAGVTLADFARFQDVFQFDLAESPAITQLKGDSEFGGLYDLLGILLAGDVKVRSLCKEVR